MRTKVFKFVLVFLSVFVVYPLSIALWWLVLNHIAAPASFYVLMIATFCVSFALTLGLQLMANFVDEK